MASRSLSAHCCIIWKGSLILLSARRCFGKSRTVLCFKMEHCKCQIASMIVTAAFSSSNAQACYLLRSAPATDGNGLSGQKTHVLLVPASADPFCGNIVVEQCTRKHSPHGQQASVLFEHQTRDCMCCSFKQTALTSRQAAMCKSRGKDKMQWLSGLS